MLGGRAQQWGLLVRGTQDRDSPIYPVPLLSLNSLLYSSPGTGLLLGPDEFETTQLSCQQAQLMPSSALPCAKLLLASQVGVLALYIAHLYLGPCWWLVPHAVKPVPFSSPSLGELCPVLLKNSSWAPHLCQGLGQVPMGPTNPWTCLLCLWTTRGLQPRTQRT